nr:hypothetical protein [Oxalobacteraceae bacterium]
MIPRTASRTFFLLMLLLHLAASVAAAEKRSGAQADVAPEAATASTDKSLAKASKWMVSSANPLASEAGRQILREGGSAVDAAIAMQMVLALVEPQSSGLGGGAFIVSYDAKRRRISTIDGRETAPAAVTSQLFIKDGKPLGFADAVNSGLSVGVPGVLRALELAHQRHGRLPWARLIKHQAGS